MTAASRRITFPGSQGSELAARLDLPVGPPRAYALFAHCFSCSKDVLTAVRLSDALTARGIALLRFDFTGLGSSQGEFANTNFSSNVADLERAAAFLREHHQAPQLLIGHSLGGAAVLAIAGELPEVRAVATLNAPSDPGHVAHLFADRIADIEAAGEAEVTLAGRKFRIQRQFLDDIAEQRLLDKVRNLRRPLLIFHSPVDRLVSIEHAAHLFQAALHPKSFVSLDDADHMVSRPSDADYVAGVLSAWAERYLDPVEAPETAADGWIEVDEDRAGKFSQTVRVGKHLLIADEPRAMGGTDRGPSPYDFLLIGLGACTAMTLRLYAERKQLPLERVGVRLHHDKIHAEDCAECETRSGRIDRIEREIMLEGDLDAATRERMLQIADMCPVHRTLHSEVSISSRLADKP